MRRSLSVLTVGALAIILPAPAAHAASEAGHVQHRWDRYGQHDHDRDRDDRDRDDRDWDDDGWCGCHDGVLSRVLDVLL